MESPPQYQAPWNLPCRWRTACPHQWHKVFFEGSDCFSFLQLQEWCPGSAVSQVSPALCLALVLSPALALSPVLVLSPAWCPVSEVSPGWQVTVPRSPIPTTQLCWGLQRLVAEGPSLPCPQES